MVRVASLTRSPRGGAWEPEEAPAPPLTIRVRVAGRRTRVIVARALPDRVQCHRACPASGACGHRTRVA